MEMVSTTYVLFLFVSVMVMATNLLIELGWKRLLWLTSGLRSELKHFVVDSGSYVKLAKHLE